MNQLRVQKISLLIIFLFSYIMLSAFSRQQQDSLFLKANALYMKGEFIDAIQLYENVLDSGQVSTVIYYNLGNAYYKSGQTAPAILNYERALRLQPNDKDIIYNLNIAKLKVVDRIENISEFFLKRWIDNIIKYFPSNIWAYMSVFFFIFILTFALLFIFGRNSRVKKMAFTLSCFLLMLGVFSFVAAGLQKKHSKNRNEAIIFRPSVTIYSTPSSDGTELFLLHEGTKVRILEQLGEWYRIQIADGNDGWIEGKSLKII